MARKDGLGRDQAEIIALQALAWLITDEDRAGRFLTLTGCDGETLRQRAGQPEVLGSVLDFLLEDEATLLDFAQSADMDPTIIPRARRYLPGTMDEDQPRVERR
jgi:Protein of unknown function (DUF3572)